MNNRKLGEFGEKVAEKYLRSRGFNVLQKNWTCRWGEIDIIAEKGDVIVFIEVKYRSSSTFGSPHDSINHKKLKSLKNSIWRYLLIHNQFHKECGLDVICIYPKQGKFKLQHYKSVSF